MAGVIAVALTEKKEQPFTFDARPSLIVFFCFSDPFNPQVWKSHENAALNCLFFCLPLKNGGGIKRIIYGIVQGVSVYSVMENLSKHILKKSTGRFFMIKYYIPCSRQH